MNQAYVADFPGASISLGPISGEKSPTEYIMKRLIYLNESIEAMKKDIQRLNSLYSFSPTSTFSPAPKKEEPKICKFCRVEGHVHQDCRFQDLLKNASIIDRLPGFFILEGWLIAFPKGKYPILVGRVPFDFDYKLADPENLLQEVRKLKMVDGVVYATSLIMKHFEYLTDHEFSIIQTYDFEMSLVVTRMKLW